MERCTITAKDVAEYLGVHTDMIYDLVRQGSFPHIRFGRKILFSREAVDEWVRDQANGSVTGKGNDNHELY